MLSMSFQGVRERSSIKGAREAIASETEHGPNQDQCMKKAAPYWGADASVRVVEDCFV